MRQSRRQTGAAVGLIIPRESGDDGLAGPVTLFVGEQFREQSQVQPWRRSVDQRVHAVVRWQPDLLSQPVPRLGHIADYPFHESTKRAPKGRAQETEVSREL